ncbi:MAG TPA: prepilin-type N-terminal cleavage/methylation domain-containing protein [Candidatus Omnitrophota bacterium]|nr:prepilin-type N-terminal cleavage/methylation domain-containing protein [Candidatus Omnitrophota bacterium]HQO58071.1 prepilin-type N-terminal cleavage/methylation domain-containing protein [Candidatus Omnitrophota bacterium]
MRTRQAFTLAELTVVAVVLGVLSMIAIPRLGNTVERMRAEEGKQMLRAIYAAQKRYWQENAHTYTDDFDALDIEIRPNSKFENIELDASGYPLAQMDRTNGAYTLTINEMGNIYCVGTMCYDLGLY